MAQVKAVEAKLAKAKVMKASSFVSVAQALHTNFPDRADKIVSVMAAAATSASMKRKLARVGKALESLRKAGS